MVYATKTEYAAYMGIVESALPSDIDKQLIDASRLIDFATMNRSKLSENALIAKTATLEQVEYWAEIGAESDVIGVKNFRSHSVGDMSIQGKLHELAPRAKRTLMLEGLLYRGVNKL